jgi:hypothetical protein
MANRVCHGCGAAMLRSDPVPRDAACEGCGHDLRCCRNCRHWDERASGECRETEADLVSDKWRRNFCEFFDWSPAPFQADASAARAAEARAKLDALFGGPPTGAGKSQDPAAEARSPMDALFRDPGPAKDDD